MSDVVKRVATALVAAGAIAAASQAGAAVVYDSTVAFNSTVKDSGARFSYSFDFSDLALDSIDSIALTLNYSGVGLGLWTPFGYLGEAWFARVQGSNGSASSDDYFGLLPSFSTSSTFVLSAATDLGSINAFATSVANQVFTLWFSEETLGSDSFTLASARLVVNGAVTPAAVPLPAAAPLLMAGLGGLALVRRRRAKQG